MPQFVEAVSSKWKDDQHVISFPERQCCTAKCKIVVVGIGHKLTFRQVLLTKHIKNLIKQLPRTHQLQTHYNGGEGLVMTADCISASRESTKMKKSRRRIYHN